MTCRIYSLIFRLSLWLESRAVHLRDWSQRRKMACIRSLSGEQAW